jgi:hypothetical protein
MDRSWEIRTARVVVIIDRELDIADWLDVRGEVMAIGFPNVTYYAANARTGKMAPIALVGPTVPTAGQSP